MKIVRDNLFVQEAMPYHEIVPTIMEEAKAIAENQKDYIVSPQNLAFTVDDCLRVKADGQYTNFDITEFALGQLCGKLGMPMTYYEKLIKSNNPVLINLARENINTLTKNYKSSSDFMVRTNNGAVRAILTDRYTPFDNDKIIDILDSVLNDKHRHSTNSSDSLVTADDLTIRGYVNNPDRLHMRVTCAEPIKAEGVEDGLYTGISIDTSNIGTERIKCSFFIWRKICNNGMTVEFFNDHFFSQRHVSVEPDEVRKELQYTFEVFPLVAQKAQEVIARAHSIKAINELYDFTVDLKENMKLKMLSSYLKCKGEELKVITEIAATEYPRTIWGFSNAITQYAQTKSFERRIELERLAGNIMQNPRRFGLVA